MRTDFLFTVEGCFSVQDRGLAVYGMIEDLQNWPTNVGAMVELRRPDGERVETRITGIEFSHDDQRLRCLLLPPHIEASSVPLGTRVSLVGNDG